MKTFAFAESIVPMYETVARIKFSSGSELKGLIPYKGEYNDVLPISWDNKLPSALNEWLIEQGLITDCPISNDCECPDGITRTIFAAKLVEGYVWNVETSGKRLRVRGNTIESIDAPIYLVFKKLITHSKYSLEEI